MPQHLAPELLSDIRQLIDAAKQSVSRRVNAEMTMMYWKVGERIQEEILKNDRADYGKRIVATLSPQLQSAYGQGFASSALWRMVRFYTEFSLLKPDSELFQKLSWSHFRILIPLKDPDQRTFYANQIATHNWSVRQTRHHISRKVYERTRIGEIQQPLLGEDDVPIFKDPYFLDFLELRDGYVEADLEGAILREMQDFILEMGDGFSFVARQKRMIIDGEDFYLDLLFYHRKLRRLVAVELKIGAFKAADNGQLDLYLGWLDRYERQEHEEAPIGLILCAEAGAEKVELLKMNRDGIMVAEYWTQLPPKKLLEERVHQALVAARERLARRIE